MVHDIVQDIQADLRVIEQNAALLVEANFVERVHALEGLAWHVLERIENVQYEHGYREDLARLYQRATHLWQRLDAMNIQLFRRLREQIVADGNTAIALPQWFKTYVGYPMPENRQDPLGYDCLDVFVDGLLDMDSAPQESKDLESGMIGYQATPARIILDLIQRAHLKADDVFCDVGSGLGRVVLLAGLLSAAQVKGIEFEPAYCTYAQQRAQSLHLSRVSFVNVDARQADYADGTVFFLYTPCTGRMFQEVLDRLHDEARVRPITIATYGPCTERVAQQPWLRPSEQQTGHEHMVAFFTSV
jgi:Histone methylation protein DOT1